MGSPTLDVLSKACQIDPDGGGELLRLTLYEALADLTEIYGPGLDADFAKAMDQTRPELVRAYISKRLEGGDVEDVLALAGTVSKKKHDVSHERRDALGEWTKSPSVPMDKVNAFASDHKGTLDQALNANDRGGEGGRGYAQLKLAGRALTAASGGQPHAAALGMTAQLAGELGPEAERILGPSLKRTAYRYRGTERRPSPQLQKDTAHLATLAPAVASGDFTTRDASTVSTRHQQPGRPLRPSRPGDTPASTNPAGAIAAYYADVGGRPLEHNPERIRMAMTGDYNAVKLRKSIPSLPHARISLAAGKMPPSVGVILDRDGDVVSEAQGFNGDHYLPFDLRNLRRLQGGSYVRTRTTGGPTDEDIYTGLMSGARQIQVVSHSGVFTVEFDPDTRGARRYSDKARQMVGRYAAIVAQIGTGEQMQRDFTPAERQAQEAEALRRSGGDYGRARDLLREIQENDRQRIRFSSDNEAAAAGGRAQARDIAQRTIAAGGGTSTQTEARDAEELARADQAQAAKIYRLDGDGYQAAMKTLQNEFPFYIRSTKYEPWPEFYRRRNVQRPEDLSGGMATDIGYTARRGLAPASVRGKKTAEPRTETAAATSADSGSAATANVVLPVAADLGNFESDLGQTLNSALGVTKFDPLSPADEAQGADESLMQAHPSTHARHIANRMTGKQAAVWLMDPSTKPEHIEALKNGLQVAAANAASTDASETAQINYPDAAIERAVDMLDKAAMVREPYAKADGDPVLDASDKPHAFSGLPGNFHNVADYTGYLRDNPQVDTEYQTIKGLSDSEISEVVTRQINEYRELHSWGQELQKDPNAIDNAPGRLTDADSSAALATVTEGTSNVRYQELENLQKAWSVLRGVQVTRILRGQDGAGAGDAGPKVTYGKRSGISSLQVHPLGSPLSVAVSKNMARRSLLSTGRLVRK